MDRELIDKRLRAVYEYRDTVALDAIVEAIESGDFISHCQTDGDGFAVSYIPYRGVTELRQRVQHLEGIVQKMNEVLDYGGDSNA